jgi:beta-N-acetylhexosaminidase
MSSLVESVTSLPLAQKIGQLFFIGIPGPVFDDSTKKLVEDISPGGVCLFARNIKEATQTRQLLDDLRNALPVEAFLSIDQEGGLVDRLRRVMTPMPAADKLKSVRDAAELAEIIGETLLILGFNMDFAPVVDVAGQNRVQTSNGLFSRAYGSSPDEVVELAGSVLDTLESSGIVGCLKHFPGLGASEVDSHDELPVVEIGRETFEKVDLYPYKKLLRSGISIMVAHACYPNLDLQERDRNGKLLPSSLSSNVVSGLLRTDLTWNGLVITDDLEMGAIVKNYGIGEACQMAIEAGVDMLAICAGVDSIYEGFHAISSAVESGKITEERLDESLNRIAAVKSRLHKPLPLDLARIDTLSQRVAELNARLN